MSAEHTEELKLYGLAWPILVESTLMTLLATLCLWLAGHVSVAAVAIFGFSNQFRLVLDRIFRIVSVGTSVLITQHRGAQDIAGAKALARGGFTTACWLGLAAALPLLIWTELILALLQMPLELRAAAAPFLKVVAIALAFEAVNLTMFAVLRAFTLTRLSLQMVMAMNVLHLVISVPLIFGWFGLPQYGLMALAWAQLGSRLVVFLLLYYQWQKRLAIPLDWHAFWHISGHLLKPIAALGLPSAGEKIAFRVCFMTTVMMAGRMGPEALTVHAYALNAAYLIGNIGLGLGTASEIIIGHHIGAGRLRDCDQLLRRALRHTFLISATGGIVMWLFAPQLITKFNNHAELAGLLGSILFIELLASPARNSCVLLSSGLRATGDVNFAVASNLIINLICCVFLAWLLGIHFKLGLIGLWLGYCADECGRALIMYWRWRKHGWLPAAHKAWQSVQWRKKQANQRDVAFNTAK